MAQMHITPRGVAPYVIGGATGVHVLARMRRLSRQPATDTPLYFFLLRNTDVVLALGGATVVIWQLAKRKSRQQTLYKTTRAVPNGSAVTMPDKSLIAGVAHELRQIFTGLLLGLGIIRRKAYSGEIEAIPDIVKRLNTIVRRGITTIDVLEPSESTNGHEREYGA